MGDWGFADRQKTSTIGEDTANSRPTTVAANASANTKGSWIELIASSSIPADGIVVYPGAGDNNRSFLVDFAVGAAGLEQVIIPNMMFSSSTVLARSHAPYIFSIHIPSGTRISARAQTSAGGGVIRLSACLLALTLSSMRSFSRVTDYGTATGDSGGVSVDPGGSANTKGAWSEIVASSTNLIRALTVAIGNQVNDAREEAEWLLDIGIGAGGSEKVIVGDMPLVSHPNMDLVFPMVFPSILLTIPSGTRLAARAQTNITDATDRLIDVALYGVD